MESAQYARFFALALDMLCIANFDGYFQVCNPSFTRTLGYSEPELLAQPFVDFVHPDERAATMAATSQLASGQSVHFINRYRCKDGTYRWIEWHSNASIEEELIYAVARDITDRRHIEQQLRMFTQIVQSMPVGVNVWTLEDPADAATLTLTVHNSAAASATTTALESPVGKRIEQVYPGTTAIGLTAKFADIARTGQSRDFGFVDGYDTQTGAPLRLSVKGFPLPANSMCVLFENVTDRLRAKERIQIYQETVKHMQTGLLVLHLENLSDPASLRILASNRAASQFTGTELESSTGVRFVELFPAAVETGLAAIYAEVARTGQSRDLGEIKFKDVNNQDGICAVRVFAQPGNRACVMFENMTDRRRDEQLIREQADALLQLSTPMIPIADSVMVMPLIGSVDVARAKQVMETLLDGVSRHRTRTVLLDITGVSAVDTHVASALIQAAKAVRLLGAEVVLTGIRAEVAQSIVALGIDLTGVATKSSLQSAIAEEFRRRS